MTSRSALHRLTAPPPVTQPSANSVVLDLKASIDGADMVKITSHGASGGTTV